MGEETAGAARLLALRWALRKSWAPARWELERAGWALLRFEELEELGFG
jgi:hypothetical protein